MPSAFSKPPMPNHPMSRPPMHHMAPRRPPVRVYHPMPVYPPLYHQGINPRLLRLYYDSMSDMIYYPPYRPIYPHGYGGFSAGFSISI